MAASRWLALFGCVGVALGCATGTAQGTPAVTGTVGSSDGFALSAGSRLEVTLADITLADAPPVVVAQLTVPTEGTSPYRLPFTLPYNPTDILPSHTYVVSARVTDAQGQLRYLNLRPVYVLTRGALTHVEVVVDPVQRP